MNNTFWEYSIGGDEVSDGEYPTREAAEEAADNDWAEYVQENYEPHNGQQFEEELELIEYEWQDDDDPIKVSSVDSWVTYEHYHGDYKEHTIWYKGPGGVL